jgi:hypothetical protein
VLSPEPLLQRSEAQYLALIHPSARKEYSPKYESKFLHKTGPIGSEIRDGPALSMEGNPRCRGSG